MVASYTLDLDKVDELMTGDGWTKRRRHLGQGRQDRVASRSRRTAGNKRRELTEQIMQEQLKAAGFELKIKNTSADDLFGTILAAGDYQLTLYGQSGTERSTPACARIFCTENIPTKANEQLRATT